jgi:sulfotransferase famil protein
MYMPRTRLEATGLKRGLPMIFVHTPKCGGSYIAHAIGYHRERRCFTRKHPKLKGHKTYLEFKTAMAGLGMDIGDFNTFSVVRDPWSWHVSLYHYVKGLTGVERAKNEDLVALMNRIDFSEYLRWLADIKDPAFDLYNARIVSDWVVGEDGKIAVDFILRQESLDTDLRRMQATYGIRLNIPEKPVNTSRHRDYRSYYSCDEVDFIAKRHERDLQLFGYRFDS